MEEALAVHGVITGRYNEILRCLDTEPEEPRPGVLGKGPRGEVIPSLMGCWVPDAVGLRRGRGSRCARYEEVSALTAAALSSAPTILSICCSAAPRYPGNEIEKAACSWG